MQTEPVISWRDIPPTPEVDALIRQRVAALDRFHPRLIGCHVVVANPQRRQRTASGYDVRVHLQLPGPDIDVARSVRQGHAVDDLTLAVNKAFTALEKRLREGKRVLGAQEVKHHPPVLHGEIVELEPALGYGYLRADDGAEVYFQRDGMVEGRWEALSLGDRLRFREMDGEKGPFAVDVAPAG